MATQSQKMISHRTRILKHCDLYYFVYLPLESFHQDPARTTLHISNLQFHL